MTRTVHSSPSPATPARVLESLRRRRRKRGAAMVEALAAIPFFIIIFASMVYVGRLYGEKQRTLRVAKEQAWTEALRGCPGGSTPAGSGTGGVNLGQAGQYQNSAASGSTGSEVTRDFGSTTATVTGSTTADPILGGFTNNLSTGTTVMCNEVKHDGNILGALRFGWRSVRFW